MMIFVAVVSIEIVNLVSPLNNSSFLFSTTTIDDGDELVLLQLYGSNFVPLYTPASAPLTQFVTYSL